MRAPLSYGEVGATAGPLPQGYAHAYDTAVLGAGRDPFDRASEVLMTWGMHRGAGLRVIATAPRAAVGVEVVLGWGVGPLRLPAPCRVVAVLDEPGRRGFTYGTLPGHPETGEEAFAVVLAADGTVTAEITAFSRPATWYARLGSPVSRRVQRVITRRYLAALGG